MDETFDIGGACSGKAETFEQRHEERVNAKR